MERLKFPEIYQRQIFHYMNRVEDKLCVNRDLNDLKKLVNPSLCYEVLSQYYFDTMKNFWVFKNSNQNEIMYIANQMKLKVFMINEKVIIQGANDKSLYIIMLGQVNVYMKNQPRQQRIESITNYVRRFLDLKFTKKRTMVGMDSHEKELQQIHPNPAIKKIKKNVNRYFESIG